MAGSLTPFLANVLLQVLYAGLNILAMLAMRSGMHPLVLVAYRQIFGALAIAPFAYFMEWRTRPRITLPILFQIMLCSLTGATGNQLLYFVGLKNSTPTIGCALTNTLPAFTFILAVLFRQESVGIKTKSGQAKVIGTVVCVGGALFLSFYHGHTIDIRESSIHWTYAENMEKKTSSSRDQGSSILGPVCLIGSSLSWALWFIVQARVSETFPAPYTSTTLTCLMASIQCGIIALISEHNISSWSLSDGMRLIAALYAGCMCSGLAFVLSSWAIQMKGPLYVSVFSPMLLMIVAISSWALLGEKIYVGTALGSLLIVTGLYAVLWGKSKEMELSSYKNSDSTKLDEEVSEKEDLELQLNAKTDSNHNVTDKEEKQQDK